jgi:hypothetical protein
LADVHCMKGGSPRFFEARGAGWPILHMSEMHTENGVVPLAMAERGFLQVLLHATCRSYMLDTTYKPVASYRAIHSFCAFSIGVTSGKNRSHNVPLFFYPCGSVIADSTWKGAVGTTLTPSSSPGDFVGAPAIRLYSCNMNQKSQYMSSRRSAHGQDVYVIVAQR